MNTSRIQVLLVALGSWVTAGELRAEPAKPPTSASERQAHSADSRPSDAASEYNRGTALYRHRIYPQAEEAFNRALSSTGPKLQERIAYNLGNTLYRKAQSQERASPNDAMNAYRQALDHYRLAIRSDPTDRDAVFNYELTQRRLEAIKPQQASQQSQGGSSQSQPQQSETSGQSQATQTNPQQAQSQSSSSPSPSSQQTAQAASSTESQNAQQQTAQAQAGQQSSTTTREGAGQPTEQQPSSEAQQAASAPQAGSDTGKELSRQEALWILDAAKHEEQRTLTEPRTHQARERPVDQDW